MGVFACQYFDAWRCHQPGGANDPSATPPRLRTGRIARCYGGLIAALLANSLQAETLRIATFAAPLSRDGPGLLLRDIIKAQDDVLGTIIQIVRDADADVLVLTDFDYDYDGLALATFADEFQGRYPYLFSQMPNAGMPTGLDLDGNGYLGDARDAMGYGRFAGDGGIAVLSRFAFNSDAVDDFSGILWRDLAGAVLPQMGDKPFLSDNVQDILRVSSTGHWVVPVILPDGGTFSIMAFAATPPVFDGAEDMNGLRARDELRLWENVLDGTLGELPASFVVAGNSNLDPNAGDGDRAAMAAFLARADIQDPHAGSYNADWGDNGPGKLRVSYVLPSPDWQIVQAGTVLPTGGAGPHGLVWVDIVR